MYCQNCGEKKGRKRNCQHCGFKNKGKHTLLIGLILFLFAFGSIFLLFGSSFFYPNEQVVLKSTNVGIETKLKKKVIPPTEIKEVEADKTTELTEIIAQAQKTVYTIFTNNSQGSGFLYNTNGAVVTNAHVVEGEIDVSIKTIDGEEFAGKVIGYSNETDVAVIMVPELAEINPYAIETENVSQIGEEIIALGSPLGLENTATMGFVTGKDRNFLIDHYTYENILQISAPIAPGSSGGPLISKSSEKIIAINSAESVDDNTIGFSIPIFKVNKLIQQWLDHPMAKADILAQFYDANGDFFFDGLWEYGDGYFDGGESADDWDYYNYWEYDFEEDWEDEGDYDEEDIYDEETYDDTEWEEWSWDDEFDEETYDEWDDYDLSDELEKENDLYFRIEDIELEILELDRELESYPEHSEEYREILQQQIDLFEELEELLEELTELQ